ncbi:MULTISPECIES: nucleotidyl transferase AbiEii/AbiGii toxin family protein [Afipia]|nr:MULTISPECIES: nucleotidyl transferase AbiEii/AbiGii toxin family protein [Afipia]
MKCPADGNRAKDVPCYEAHYTFVEKLQTISTKYRQQQVEGTDPVGFMRHYYDAYELLQQESVQNFIGTEAYTKHKQKRFRQGDNENITQNDAFFLKDPATHLLYERAYDRGGALYYAGKPSFAEILAEFEKWSEKL